MGLLAPCWVANATCNDFGVCVLTSGGQKWEVFDGNLPSIKVIDESAPAEHVVEHAENGFFISGNDAGGEDDGVVFVDADETMIVHGNAGERRA